MANAVVNGVGIMMGVAALGAVDIFWINISSGLIFTAFSGAFFFTAMQIILV